MSDVTRDKILAVASELFAKFGFSGASVRDIAATCDVNVASINYHFGSKHNLYWAVVQESRHWAERGFLEISGRVGNIEDMVSEAYDFLMSDKDAVRTALRIMLSNGVPDPEGELKEAMEATMGPPGMNHMIKVLRKQLGDSIPEERILFAVNCIFGNLLHWAMISSCAKVDLIKKKRPDLQPDAIKQSLRLHARAICQFIKPTS